MDQINLLQSGAVLHYLMCTDMFYLVYKAQSHHGYLIAAHLWLNICGAASVDHCTKIIEAVRIELTATNAFCGDRQAA